MRDERCPRAVGLFGAQSTRYDYSNRLGCSVPSTILGIVNTSKRASPALQGSRFLILPSFIVWPVPASRAPGRSGSWANTWIPEGKRCSGLLFRNYWGGAHAGVARGVHGPAVWCRHHQPGSRPISLPAGGQAPRLDPNPRSSILQPTGLRAGGRALVSTSAAWQQAEQPPRTRTAPRLDPNTRSSIPQPTGLLAGDAHLAYT